MLIPILLLIATVVYIYGINRILGLPPGPPPLPLIGNMLHYQPDMTNRLLVWKEKYGSVFTVWLPFPMVVMGDHKVLHEQLVKNGDVFLSKKNPDQFMDILAGGKYGLVFEDNSIVKEQRKFALKSLHEIGFGSAAMEDAVHHYAQEVVKRWKQAGDSPVDVTHNIMRAVGNIVWRVMFGLTLDFDNPILNRFRKLQDDWIPLMSGPFMMFLEKFPILRIFDNISFSPVCKAKPIFEEINGILEDNIIAVEKSFNADNQPSGYIEAFIAEMKKREKAGVEMGSFHFDQMLASAGGLWGAGFDTTVSALRLCCLQLANHPEMQRKMQKEIDDVIGARTVFLEDQKLLPYTSAFLQEIYRLLNILPLHFLRLTTQDAEIEGFHIRAGTTILPQFSMVHLDPKEFERPDYFCPERHINEQRQFVKDPRVAPFTVGRRSCLGETLARMELFVMLTTFVQNCHFIPVNKVPPAAEIIYGFTNTTAPFLVKIQPRT